MITVGLDIGTQYIKIAVFKDNILMAKNKILCGFDLKKSIEQIFESTLKICDIKRIDIQNIIVTGAGKDIVEFATGSISIIGAIARAGVYLFPQARMMIDIGAEESRVVVSDAKANILDFGINDMCAAGAGSFIEAMSRVLEVNLEDMGKLALNADESIPINTQCVIFAETEVISLIHRNVRKDVIARSIYDVLANRISSMVHRFGRTSEIAVFGGIANDVGFIDALRRKVGKNLLIPDGPEFGCAIGAAISGVEK